MAIDLGELGFAFKGDWSGITTYKKNEVVRDTTDGNNYIAIINNTGVTPLSSIGVTWALLGNALTDLEKSVFATFAAGTSQTLSPQNKVLDTPKINVTGGNNCQYFLMADNSVKATGISSAHGGSSDRYTGGVIAFNATTKPTITKLFQGMRSCFALDNLGIPWVVGENTTGHFGIGNTTDQKLFQKIAFFETAGPGGTPLVITNIVLSRGWDLVSQASAYFLTNLGLVYACGYGAYGNLGDGASVDRLTPVRCGTITGMTRIAVGGSRPTVFAWNHLATGNNLYGWGQNAVGAIGNGSTTNVPSPTLLTTISNVVSVDTSDGFSSLSSNYTGHSLACVASGLVFATGGNPLGQLGQGNTTNTTSWVQVPGLTNIVSVFTNGGYYGSSMCLSATKVFSIWGANNYGIIGNNTTATVLSPYTPPFGTGIGQLPIQGLIDEIQTLGVFSQKTLILRSGNTICVSGQCSVGQNSNGVFSSDNNFRLARGVRGNVTKIIPLTSTDGLTGWSVLYQNGEMDACGHNGSGSSGTSTNSASAVNTLTNINF